MEGDAYEQWVTGIDLGTGRKKGRVREDANALRFVEVIVNGPKTWSLAAALHPEVSAALDEAQDKAAAEIVPALHQSGDRSGTAPGHSDSSATPSGGSRRSRRASWPARTSTLGRGKSASASGPSGG